MLSGSHLFSKCIVPNSNICPGRPFRVRPPSPANNNLSYLLHYLINLRLHISPQPTVAYLVVKYFSPKDVCITFCAIEEAEPIKLMYKFLPFAEAQKDGRKPVPEPRDALMRFSGASIIAIGQLIS